MYIYIFTLPIYIYISPVPGGTVLNLQVSYVAGHKLAFWFWSFCLLDTSFVKTAHASKDSGTDLTVLYHEGIWSGILRLSLLTLLKAFLHSSCSSFSPGASRSDVLGLRNFDGPKPLLRFFPLTARVVVLDLEGIPSGEAMVNGCKFVTTWIRFTCFQKTTFSPKVHPAMVWIPPKISIIYKFKRFNFQRLLAFG